MLNAILKNKKHRNILILCILSLVLIVLVIIQLSRHEEPPPEGALRVVICRNCGAKYSTRIKDLKDKTDENTKCKECGERRLGFAWKCDECQFEYPELELQAVVKKMDKTMDKFQAIVESRRCPNCSSLACHPLTVNELKGDKKKKIKIPKVKIIKQ